jgi:hypothetical protein
MFNTVIESLDLRENELYGRQFTWATHRDMPTFEKLDRVLASVEWENKFPLVSVRALTRTGSDHTPLLIDSGEQAHLGNKSLFYFELSWLRQDGFLDMVKKEWLSVPTGASPMENWQNKIRHLRSYLRGWAKNMSSVYKSEKSRLTSIIDALDLKAETILLSDDKRRCLKKCK